MSTYWWWRCAQTASWEGDNLHTILKTHLMPSDAPQLQYHFIVEKELKNHFISLLHTNLYFCVLFKDKNLPCKNDIESAWVFWVHYVYELYVCLMLMKAREDTRFLSLEVQKAVSQHGCWESNANHWATSRSISLLNVKTHCRWTCVDWLLSSCTVSTVMGSVCVAPCNYAMF